MRTIKFRGIDTMSGEMVYGDLVQQELTDGSITTAIVQTYATYDVVPDTVGQFTGLHDKNGKPIYEGDIIGSQESNHYLEVRYIDGMFRLFGLDDVTGFGSIPASYLMDENNCVLEIVGNIFDFSLEEKQ